MNRKNGRVRNLAGFTLLELLIALAIFSVAAASLYFNFHTGLLLYSRTQKQGRQLQDLRLCLEKLESDLQNAVVYDEVPFTGERTLLRFASVTESYDHMQRRLQPREIVYTFSGGKLFRQEQELSADYLKVARSERDWVLSHVENFSFEYGYRGPEGSLVWRDQWGRDTDGKADLVVSEIPRVMRVSFTLEEAASGKPEKGSKSKSLQKQTPRLILKSFDIPQGGIKELVVG